MINPRVKAMEHWFTQILFYIFLEKNGFLLNTKNRRASVRDLGQLRIYSSKRWRTRNNSFNRSNVGRQSSPTSNVWPILRVFRARITPSQTVFTGSRGTFRLLVYKCCFHRKHALARIIKEKCFHVGEKNRKAFESATEGFWRFAFIFKTKFALKCKFNKSAVLIPSALSFEGLVMLSPILTEPLPPVFPE